MNDSELRSRVSGRTPKQKGLLVWRRNGLIEFCSHEIDFDAGEVASATLLTNTLYILISPSLLSLTLFLSLS